MDIIIPIQWSMDRDIIPRRRVIRASGSSSCLSPCKSLPPPSGYVQSQKLKNSPRSCLTPSELKRLRKEVCIKVPRNQTRNYQGRLHHLSKGGARYIIKFINCNIIIIYITVVLINYQLVMTIQQNALWNFVNTMKFFCSIHLRTAPL